MSGDEDGNICFWNTVSFTEEVERSVEYPMCTDSRSNSVQALCFSPDGKSIAVESSRQTRIYDVESSQWSKTLADRFISSVTCAEFILDDDGVLVAGCMDGTVRFWDAVSGNLLATIESGDYVEDLAICSGGEMAVVALTDGTSVLIDVNERRIVRKINPPTLYLTKCVRVCPDGSKIAIGLEDGSIQLLAVSAIELEVSSSETIASVGDLDLTCRFVLAARLFDNGGAVAFSSSLRPCLSLLSSLIVLVCARSFAVLGPYL